MRRTCDDDGEKRSRDEVDVCWIASGLRPNSLAYWTNVVASCAIVK
jgi:hypothetical protein